MTGACSSEKSIFLDALDIEAAAERARFLDRACAGQPQLRSSVEALLRAHEAAHELLDSAVPRLTECAGTKIGPYKLLEVIGEGGFGIVFMAQQQEPVRRKVALKILKPGMDTRQVVARFEAERQALAMMDHPNIARVFDGGEAASGRPFFAMELVTGVPITDFCNQKNLNVRSRLELFIDVCQAVQHAHQKGVIHRDLKPSNIMVTLHDGTPVVKVIDFGIAKAIGEQLTEKTLFTNFAHLMGTPIYMSPEQAEMSGLDIDTRTDIYSLGVLLYELLTGTTPFDKERLKSVSFDEMRRIIREEEAETVSARLAKTRSTRSVDAGVNHRTHALLSELDWIVVKALEKDRNRRYESASALAADLQRYLSDEPVHACPPSAWYRFRKFARRNKVALTTASVICAVLVVATLVSGWQAVRAKNAERQAKQSLAAEKQARQDAEVNLAKARQVVDQYLTLTSESRLLDVPGLQPLRKELLEAALVYYEDFLKQHPTDPELQAELAAACLRMGQIYMAVGADSEALAALDRAVNLIEKLRADYPRARNWEVRVAGTHKLGRNLHYGNEGPATPTAALKVLERGSRLWEQMATEHPEVAGFRSDLAEFLSLRADLELVLGHFTQALSEFRQASDLWAKLTEENPAAPDYRLERSRTLDGIGKVLERLGRPREAEESYRQCLALRQQLAAEFPGRSDYLVEVAYAGLRLARRLPADQDEEKEAAVRQALGLLVKLVAECPGVPSLRENLGICHYDLARVLRRTDRSEESIATCREALAIYERLKADFPAQHSYADRCAAYSRDLAVMLFDAGRPEEAERYYAHAIMAMEPVVADVPQQIIYRRRLAEVFSGQGDLLWSMGRRDKAAAAFRRAIELRQGVMDESPDVPLHVRELVRLWATCPLAELRDKSRIMELANEAVRLAPGEPGAWYSLGMAHYAAANWQAALSALDQAAEKSPGDALDWLDAGIGLVRAMNYWQLSQSHELTDEQRSRYQAEARQCYARAEEWLTKNQPVDNEPRRLRSAAGALLQISGSTPNPAARPPPDL